MPFGKYRGVPLDEVPRDYLRWLLDDCDLREPLRSAVAKEFAARVGDEPSATDDGLSTAVIRLELPRHAVPVARELVQLGRRTAAQRHHPDAGGDAGRMVQVNATADQLLAALGGVS